MPSTIIPLLPLLLPLAPLVALFIFATIELRGRYQRRRAEADPQIRVDSLTNDTVLAKNGSVKSIQSGDVWIKSGRLQEIWTAENLERLARTYWYQLGKVSFRTLRVMYTPHGRAMALFGLIPMITFEEPEYELDDRKGSVKWIIRNGVLVSPRGRDKSGYLGIEVEHLDSDRPGYDRVHVELSVVNFYPSMADRLSKRLYSLTQSRIHVLVAYSFLRNLAHGQLVPSKVGRFAQWPKELGIRREERREAKEAARNA